MANLIVLDGNGDAKYLKETGAGTSGDPHAGHVNVDSSALPTGAATEAKQDAQTTLLGAGLPAALGANGGLQVEGVAGGEAVPVSGTFFQVTQPVSAASLPLPAGAATSALQGGGLPAALGTGGGLKVDGSGTALPVSAASLPLPAGAATSALQGGGLPAALGLGGGIKVDGSGTALPVSGTFWQATQPVSIATAPALVASDALIGHAPPDTTSVTVTPTCEAAAYHAGDVLFDSAEIASVARANGKGVELVSLVARDLDDQAAAALTLFFFNANTSLGTKNAAPDIDDTEILTLLGIVVIPAAAWIDVGASKVAVMQNIGQLMTTGGATASLWVAGMTAGTPTQTASGISLTFQFVRY